MPNADTKKIFNHDFSKHPPGHIQNFSIRVKSMSRRISEKFLHGESLYDSYIEAPCMTYSNT